MTSPCPELALIDLARLLRPIASWERRFHEYELLLNAGISPDEAAEIVTNTESDREAERLSRQADELETQSRRAA